MPDATTNLPPCPFCGSTHVALYDQEPDEWGYVFTRCKKCGAIWLCRVLVLDHSEAIHA